MTSPDFFFLPVHYTAFVTIIDGVQQLPKPSTATKLVDVSVTAYYIQQTTVLRVFHDNVDPVDTKSERCREKLTKDFHRSGIKLDTMDTTPSLWSFISSIILNALIFY